MSKHKRAKDRVRRRTQAEQRDRDAVALKSDADLVRDALAFLDRTDRHDRANQIPDRSPVAPIPPVWPELAEEDARRIHREDPTAYPPLDWRTLEREAAERRQYFIEHPEEWANRYSGEHYKVFGRDSLQHAGPESYDMRNIQHFQSLPTIEDHRRRAMTNAAQMYGVFRKQRPDVLRAIIESVRAEQTHLLYHRAMWQAHGRRVYVLDRTTYELLAATPLPRLPASVLSMPLHSFYLLLPRRAFEFEVKNERIGQVDKAWCEGAMISLDKIEPDYQGTRELAFTVVGEYSPGPNALGVPAPATLRSEGRNTAFISMRIGADAMLSEISFGGGVRCATSIPGGWTEYAAGELAGSEELGVLMPRIVIGLLLYLASEHPDVEPVPPAPRRNVDAIQNPIKRKRAIEDNRNASRLPMLLVGRKLREEISREREEVTRSLAAAGRTLDHPVWVRGHWRYQPYGPERAYHRTIWIRPYLKGPDVAESLSIRAAKIQKAQHTPSPYAGE